MREAGISEGESQSDAAKRLAHEEQTDVRRAERSRVHRHLQHGEEDHDGHPIIEERFPGDLHLQAARYPGLLEDAQHGDRIGRRDQRTEEQTVDERGFDTEQRKQQKEDPADEEGGNDNAERAEQDDRQPLLLEFIELDVDGTGEEHEAEHDLQQQFAEVDPLHERCEEMCHVGEETSDDDQQDGDHQGDEHQSDGCRQFDVPEIDIGEQRR